jgi:serine/threonine protein kinase
LGDFGLGKYVGADGLCGTSCGSPYYASPECLSGKSYNAKKSDIWSCGIALYWMLVGRPPWTERNHFQLFEQIRRGDLKIPAELPESCRDLLAKLLTVDPDRRISIPEAFEHPWFKAGPNPKFPEEDPIPYIGIRKVESLFEDAIPTIDSMRRSVQETASVRGSTLSSLERWIAMPAVRAQSLLAMREEPQDQKTKRRAKAVILAPGVKAPPSRSGGSRRGVRMGH